jgi:hypothetical protein
VLRFWKVTSADVLLLICSLSLPGTTLNLLAIPTAGTTLVGNQQSIKTTLATRFTDTTTSKITPQNPSPMVEHTRSHERVKEERVKGLRVELSVGELFLPDQIRFEESLPLLVHFHGAPWLVQYSLVKSGRQAVLLSIHIGAGSRIYREAFQKPERFYALLEEAREKFSKATGHEVRWRTIMLSAWSAGFGAIQKILADSIMYERISTILLLDGLHTDYLPGWEPQASYRPVKIDTEPLKVFLRFARDAVEGKKTFWILHSEVFPGTFASTTETADYLLEQLVLKRTPVLRWGPVGMQQLSETIHRGFRVLGFAGNSAPDHLDFIHGFWRWLEEIPFD